MIAIDSSAVVAILFDEPLSDILLKCLNDVAIGSRYLSTASYVETGTVLAGRIKSGNPMQAIEDLDRFLNIANIQTYPVDEEQMRLAMKARVEYGRGFGASAGLNFGDCFSYALAKKLKAPLLYVGNDFSRTDVMPAVEAD